MPPYVPHQEINASDEAPLSCVLVRSGQEPVVVNLDLPNVEANPETVEWVDDLHRLVAISANPSLGVIASEDPSALGERKRVLSQFGPQATRRCA